jgi:hypothetical protein
MKSANPTRQVLSRSSYENHRAFRRRCWRGFLVVGLYTFTHSLKAPGFMSNLEHLKR